MNNRSQLLALKNAALLYVAKINKVSSNAEFYRLLTSCTAEACPVSKQVHGRWHHLMSATQICSHVECPLYDDTRNVFWCVPFPAPTSANRAARLQAFIKFIAFVNVLLSESGGLNEQDQTP